MEEQEAKTGIKVGAFVVGGIVLCLGSLFYIGKEGNLFNKTFTVSAAFKNVEGLTEGDNVWLSGVKIGTVQRVQIVAEGKVIVSLTLKDKQNQFIKKNATAFIGSDGLVGNKIVVIRPGNANESIQDNDTLNALSPTDTQELFNLAKDVGVSIRSITGDLKLISERLNSGKGVLGELLSGGPVSDDLRATILTLKSTGDNTNKLTLEANRILEQVGQGDGLVTKLITDSSYAKSFETALQSLSKASENSKKMTEDLQTVVAKMHSGNNAIGILMSDSLFANKLRETLENTRTASIKLDENMIALQHNFLLRGYFRKQKKAESNTKKNDVVNRK
jgi:phospholipid/cholesterol/gamma-HCH transport system substrate-binding protein